MIQKKKFDVVDIDPYGSASEFLDSAVQCVDDGGLLCVTCTDLSVLCGNNPEVSWTKYQSIAIKSKASHEAAFRIVLNTIQSHALKYKRVIEPLVSIFVDFYVRIFVRVHTSSLESKSGFSRVGYGFQCNGCESLYFQKLGTIEPQGRGVKYKVSNGFPIEGNCEHCDNSFKTMGPLWLDPIHNKDWLDRAITHLNEPESVQLYKTHKRLLGLLSVCREELDIPLFYGIQNLCSKLGLVSLKEIQIRSALIKLGFKVSSTHCEPNAIKTDAPPKILWDILRCWHKLHPAKIDKEKPNTVKFKILSKEPEIESDFTELEEAKSKVTIPKFFKIKGGGPKAMASGKKKEKKKNLNNTMKKRKINEANAYMGKVLPRDKFLFHFNMLRLPQKRIKNPTYRRYFKFFKLHSKNRVKRYTTLRGLKFFK